MRLNYELDFQLWHQPKNCCILRNMKLLRWWETRKRRECFSFWFNNTIPLNNRRFFWNLFNTLPVLYKHVTYIHTHVRTKEKVLDLNTMSHCLNIFMWSLPFKNTSSYLPLNPCFHHHKLLRMKYWGSLLITF